MSPPGAAALLGSRQHKKTPHAATCGAFLIGRCLQRGVEDIAVSGRPIKRRISRKMRKMPSVAVANFEAVHREAAGLLTLNVIRPERFLGLVLASMSGDAEAARLVQSAVDTVARIERAPRREPKLCGCCPRILRKSKFVICVAYPAVDSPETGIAFALCERCSGDDAVVRDNASKALRAVWPDLRPITVTHGEGGRA
jgi:hypothetical protein